MQLRLVGPSCHREIAKEVRQSLTESVLTISGAGSATAAEPTAGCRPERIAGASASADRSGLVVATALPERAGPAMTPAPESS